MVNICLPVVPLFGLPSMTPNTQWLEQIRSCCRDDAAFAQLQHLILAPDLGDVLAAVDPQTGENNVDLAQDPAQDLAQDPAQNVDPAQAIAALTQERSQLRFALAQQQALAQVIHRIRESLDATRVFSATAREVRHLLGADRVAIFQFDPQSGYDDGEFIAESVGDGYDSALAARVHDHCFGEQYAVQYQQDKIQAVGDIYAANLSDCHIDILSKFQVRANLIVPLLQGKMLWGLLCLHQCSGPREWQATDIEFVRQVATHLGVMLQHIDLLHQTRSQTQTLNEILHNLRDTQTQLVQTEKMSSLGHLVAGVAHEINNPVNFIYGNLTHTNQYIQDILEVLNLYRDRFGNQDPDVQELTEELDLDFLLDDLPKMLKSMRVGVDRIRQIVLSLRNFSRVDEATKKPADLHEGLDSTMLILQSRLKGRSGLADIQVMKNYGDIPPVECFSGQINQVFMNIISNAIDALDDAYRTTHDVSQPQGGPTITITTALLNQDMVRVAIADNGPGIPDAVVHKLFDTFFTTKPVGKGTGLGLSISHQIITQKHGGHLHCHSVIGQGTEFCVDLPIAAQDGATP
jgi:signal transduction histidine kinase